MKYKYPRITNLLTYERIDPENVLVKDLLTDEIYTFGIEYVRYIRKLDGRTHPYDIPTALNRYEIDYVLDFIEENELTRQNDLIVAGKGHCFYPLIMFRKISRRTREIASVLDFLLLTTWLPIFILGITLFANVSFYIGDDGGALGSLFGLVVGTLLHEMGHVTASLACGTPVFEFGVMVQNFLLPGAYVINDHTYCKNRIRRIQVFAAGVEVNLLLCGLFLIFASLIKPLSCFLFYAAFSNGIMGALNLIFIDGLDGCSVMAELLGVENLVDKAKLVVSDAEIRWDILQQGVLGKATVVTCYVIRLIQKSLPIIIIVNLVGVLVWIF